MTQHRIRLFFDFSFSEQDIGSRLAHLTVAGVADPSWIHPARLRPDAKRPIADAALWDWAAWRLSPDLNASLHSVLNASSQAPGEQPLILSRSANGRALMEGRYRADPDGTPRRPGLVIVLGAAPRLRSREGFDRIVHDEGQAGVAIEVEIESLTVHLFRTGVGLVVPSLRLRARERGLDLSPETLVDIVPRLGDERGAPAYAWLDGWAEPGAARFSLSTLLGPLVEPAGGQVVLRERVYSYTTVVREDAVLPDRDLAYRLSRHYNSNYRPTPDYLGTNFVAPFETVLHAASREGNCTLVANGTEPELEFLANWLDHVEANAYFPLQVAVMHEYIALLGMAQGAGSPLDPDVDDRRTIGKMRALSHRFMLFRLRYRLLQVSRITAHELAFSAAADALGIEPLSTKIARDLVEVERRLSELATERSLAMQAQAAAQERRRERKTAWLTGIGSGALGYITMATFGDHISSFLHSWDLANGSARFWLEVAFQLIGAGLAAWGFYYAVWWKHGSHHEAEHMFEHARTEVTLAHHEEAVEGHTAGTPPHSGKLSAMDHAEKQPEPG